MNIEDRVLELNNKGLTQVQIANELGLYQSNVCRILKKYDINNSKVWTEEEELILQENYGVLSLNAIARRLNRPVGGVKSKAYRLGLGRTTDASEYLTLKDLARAFKTDPTHIRKVWVENRGLKVKYKILNQKRKFYQVCLREFWKWAEDNKECLNFSKLEVGLLGDEPAWVAKKRKQDFSRQDRKKHQFWTLEEDKLLKMYWSTDKKCDDIGKILGRSFKAVEKRARKIGLKHKKIEINWREVEVKILIDMKLKGHTDREIAEEIGRTEGNIRWKRSELMKKGLLDWQYRQVSN